MNRASTVLLAACAVLFLHQASLAQSVAITKPIFTYTQNFDSLASSGSSSTLPYGWRIYETGSAANTSYTADSGALSTGDTYSYGHKGSSDRALGSLSSGSLDSYFGAEFTNRTGYSINSITVSYTVEQWRLGATGRADSSTASVTTAASSLAFGFWVSLPLLDIRSVVTSGTTGQLDGNNAANRKKYTYTLAGISVANGSSIWVRWQDVNISGANDGLAIDDFSLSVKAYIPHTIASSKFPQKSGIPDTTQTGVWKGIVLGQNLTPNGLDFQFMDSTGSITAIGANTFGYTPSEGDSVAVYGHIKSSNYLTYIGVDSVGKISAGYSPSKPKIVTNINNDTLESGLAEIAGMSLATGYKWDTTGGYKNAGLMTTMTNGTNTYNVWVSSNSDLYTAMPPKFPFNLIGIVLQNGTTPTTGYYIWPRNKADIDTIPLPLYSIAQVRPIDISTGVADSANTGHLVLLDGIVQSPDFLKSGLVFSMADITGSIMTVSSSVTNFTPVVGENIRVRGLITQSNGITEISADSIWLLDKSLHTLPASIDLTLLNESDEAKLVKYHNATIVDSTKWIPSGTSFTVKYTDGIDTVDVVIFNNTDLYQMKHAPAGKFNITGIEGQSKSSLPYLGAYQLWPRGFADYEKILPFKPLPLYKIASLKGYNAATGIADSLGKGKGFVKGVVHSQSFAAGSLSFALIDNTGAITVVSSTIKYYAPVIGDSILVSGSVAQNNGLTEYNADSIIVLTKGTWLQAAALVTKLDESTESGLVKLDDVYLADTSEWKPLLTAFNTHITNGQDTFLMTVNSTVDLYKMRPPKGHFNITGIAIQNDPNSPYLSDYAIQPRGLSDFQHVTQLYKIRQVRVQDAVTGVADSAAAVTPFYLKGIVQSPDFVTSGLDFSLTDSSGSVFVFSPLATNGYAPSDGDSIFVRGLVRQSDGLTEVLVDSVSKLANAGSVPSAKTVTALDESTEANLVSFKNAWLANPAKWAASGLGFNVLVTNGNDTVLVFVSNATDLFHKPAPKGKFNITGIGSQSKIASPYFGGYFMMPRAISDINALPAKLYSIASVKRYDAVTGVADSINTYCMLGGVVSSGNLSGNSTMFFPMSDHTGAITVVGKTAISAYVPALGDSVVVRGTVGQVNGLTVFNADSVSKISTTGNLDVLGIASMSENSESYAVSFRSLFRLTDTIHWDTTAASGRVFVTAINNVNKDSVKIEIVKGTDIYGLGELFPGEFFLDGIESQNDSVPPYLTDYLLIPRNVNDIVYLGIAPQNPLNSYIHLYPNPVADHLGISSPYKIDRVEIIDMVGQTVLSQCGNLANGLDLSALKPGIYIVITNVGQDVSYQKIIKD